MVVFAMKMKIVQIKNKINSIIEYFLQLLKIITFSKKSTLPQIITVTFPKIKQSLYIFRVNLVSKTLFLLVKAFSLSKKQDPLKPSMISNKVYSPWSVLLNFLKIIFKTVYQILFLLFFQFKLFYHQIAIRI